MLLFYSSHPCNFHAVVNVSINWDLFHSGMKNLENALNFAIPHFAVR